MLMRKIASVAALSLLTAAPALAQSKATIDKLNQEWAAAFNSGDAAAVAAMYDDGAAVLPPGAEMVKGRSNIEAFWQAATRQLGNVKLATVDLKRLGRNTGREIGTLDATIKSEPPQAVQGKYVVVWRKRGKEWKIDTDIWNMNK